MLKLAGTAGLALAVANLRRRARNLAVRGVLAVAGAVALVIALCFFLVALHVWLAGELGVVASASIIGGALLAVALLLLFLASRPMREQARAVEQPAARVGDALGEGMARLAEAAGSARSPLRNPVFQAAGLALIAGIFLGRRRKPDRD
jgi:hypothetical protein